MNSGILIIVQLFLLTGALDFNFFLNMAELRTIELLNLYNYHSWKMKMQQLLQLKGIWQTVVENQPTFTKEMEKFAYWNKLDGAMGLIRLHVSNSLLFHLDGCDTPKKS